MALKTEQENQQFCDRTYAESLATALSAHLIKHYSVQNSPLEDYSHNLPQSSLKAAIDFIVENLDQPLALAALARLTPMSSSHFAHSFKAALGISPHQFIVQKRIEKAKYLLQHSSLTVREIAYQCGFSSQSHLDTTFRRYEGGTPCQYRQPFKT
jgi:AraC family transcriptional regulator